MLPELPNLYGVLMWATATSARLLIYCGLGQARSLLEVCGSKTMAFMD
jgi:hypothetical protein